MPAHLQCPLPEKWENMKEYNENLTSRMQKAHALASKYVGKNMATYEKQYNKKSWQQDLQVGTWVWLNNWTKKKGLSPKLQVKWEKEPYQITDFLSEVVIKIKKYGSKQQRVIHVNKVKRVGDQAKWAEKPPSPVPRKTQSYTTDAQGFPILSSRQKSPERGTRDGQRP